MNDQEQIRNLAWSYSMGLFEAVIIKHSDRIVERNTDDPIHVFHSKYVRSREYFKK